MPVKEKPVTFFSFSLPNLRGSGSGGPGELLGKLVEANIALRAITGVAVGGKIHLLCVAENRDKFRDFLKEEKVRATEKEAIQITATRELQLRLLNRWAISGELTKGFTMSNKGSAFFCKAEP